MYLTQIRTHGPGATHLGRGEINASPHHSSKVVQKNGGAALLCHGSFERSILRVPPSGRSRPAHSVGV